MIGVSYAGETAVERGIPSFQLHLRLAVLLECGNEVMSDLEGPCSLQSTCARNDVQRLLCTERAPWTDRAIPRRYDVLPVRGPAPIVHRTKCKSMQIVRTASPPGEYAASTQESTGWYATGPKSTCESLDLGSYPTPWGFNMRLIKSLLASDDIDRSTWSGIATMRSGT